MEEWIDIFEEENLEEEDKYEISTDWFLAEAAALERRDFLEKEKAKRRLTTEEEEEFEVLNKTFSSFDRRVVEKCP